MFSRQGVSLTPPRPHAARQLETEALCSSLSGMGLCCSCAAWRWRARASGGHRTHFALRLLRFKCAIGRMDQTLSLWTCDLGWSCCKVVFYGPQRSPSASRSAPLSASSVQLSRRSPAWPLTVTCHPVKGSTCHRRRTMQRTMRPTPTAQTGMWTRVRSGAGRVVSRAGPCIAVSYTLTCLGHGSRCGVRRA